MSQYYWTTENGVLYHTGVGPEQVDPFFDSVERAEDFLEQRADLNGNDQYEGAILREATGGKVKEATAVLTSQSGLAQFAAGD